MPQLPTIVSNLVKYGPNLLQAVGEFNGTLGSSFLNWYFDFGVEYTKGSYSQYFILKEIIL